MYEITINTTNGAYTTEINDMAELDIAIAPYQKTYIGVSAVYKEGEAKNLPKPIQKKYNTTVKITDYDINWKKIKQACMTTISKEAGPKEPSSE